MRLYRKAFLTQAREHDDLEMVVPRRHTPLFWPFMLAVSVSMTAFFAWCLLARLPLIVEAKGIVMPLGGVREVSTVGQGLVTQRMVANGERITAGQLILTLNNPERQATYETARRHFEAARRAADVERAAIGHKRDRDIAMVDQQLAAAKESYDRLLSIREKMSKAVGSDLTEQAQARQADKASLQDLARSYEELLIGLRSLKDQKLVAGKDVIAAMENQTMTVRALTKNSADTSRANVDEQRIRFEQSNIADAVERLATQIADLSRQYPDIADKYELEQNQLELRQLAEREKLLDAERLAWWNTYAFSPYDGTTIAVNRTVGQTVGGNAPIALINMSTQRRRWMLVISDRAYSGDLRLRLGNSSADVSLVSGNLKAFRAALSTSIAQLISSSAEVRISGDDHRLVVDYPGSEGNLSLQSSSLVDAKGCPCFR